ncbi:SDR family oxidoreductase [Brevundimonas variabilis]|uniref:NAD(P)-dependent dehydrogenase (Short-subunit alcohol dehydrogenase family) n=1 Tax=Brevundimonas variabilis TaxID=74312 RepID=A0A7W9FEZ8_9CAUL|nr:SDR family oxidoreductase [Brevundimonas variabilis]MBB5746951.1 NAD(P)-dependent dehydrogenase (short-subunit alcohol dehydrogenase family) [Brevundimonas variabilis]
MVWTANDIPDLTGRLVIVTGSNSGTGYETARVLAGRGADVVMAARNAGKAEVARQSILAAHPGALVRYEALDLASLASVTDFADRFARAGRPIDILVNNAGVMALPRRQVSVDGFELQMATNYFGHFALTARLLPLLSAGAARVVQVSSIVHRQGQIRLEDLNHETGYRPWPVYAQSKLAMLMFALELARRNDANGWGLTSVAAHPGYARTSLIENGPMVSSALARAALKYVFRPFIEPMISHSAAEGALPILLAATSPDVKSGAYFGPLQMSEMKGPPGVAEIRSHALDADVAARLWSASERLTGVTFG